MATANEKQAVRKITVSLKPAGDAPTLNKSKFLVESDKTVGWLHQWLRKAIKCEPDESTFVYVSQCFAPPLDQDLDTLHQCYGTGEKLILHYCKSQAWG
ncbi:ubiquitin-like protein ATG12 [Halichondria panicea]|uniref:ubiquitin-like protein ATG12 n=1 Tax=Halichondria panicea TaxID=6063 RepID=UPI00312B504B